MELKLLLKAQLQAGDEVGRDFVGGSNSTLSMMTSVLAWHESDIIILEMML